MKNHWLEQEIKRNSKAGKSAFVKSVVWLTLGKPLFIAVSHHSSSFLCSWVITSASEVPATRTRAGNFMLCLIMVDMIMSTDCCLCGSSCAVDTRYLSWLFKLPGSYSHSTRHPTAWVLLHLACGVWYAMTYVSTCIAVSGLMLLSCHPHGIPFKCPLTNSHHRHMNYRVEHPLRASWISLLFPFQVTKNERQVMKPLYDRYRLVKQILSRANSIPIIVSKAFLWGLFFGFELR